MAEPAGALNAECPASAHIRHTGGSTSQWRRDVVSSAIVERGDVEWAASVASAPLLFGRFACCVSRIPSRLFLGLNRRLAFSLFGCNQRLESLLLALGRGSELGLARSLCGQFRLALSLGRLARSLAHPARLVDCRSGGEPLGGCGVLRCCAKLF